MATLLHNYRFGATEPRQRAGDAPPDYAADLARDLKERIAGEVRFDPGYWALYSTDASNYRQVPIGVVIPRYGCFQG